ncbi:MAG: hypothetical protein KKF06_04245 [Candidatus Margulisbacteria bacterium]|nr:hypothetical protein [Candidatus Margulisiibacteriota bacterium]MBU1867571.1 hypothetical protein [Candidatus Margulisiibacteriota bacterium]
MLSKIMAQLPSNRTIARFRLKMKADDIDRRIAGIKLMARIGPGVLEREEPLKGKYCVGEVLADGSRIVKFGPYQSSNGYFRREIPIALLEEALGSPVLPAGRGAKLNVSSPDAAAIKVAAGIIRSFDAIWPGRVLFPPKKETFRGQETAFASFGAAYQLAHVKMFLHFKDARWELGWTGYRLAEMSRQSPELSFLLGSKEDQGRLEGWQILNTGTALFCKRLAEPPFFLRPGDQSGYLALNVETAGASGQIYEQLGLTAEGIIEPPEYP